jgi:hypothetical protein
MSEGTSLVLNTIILNRAIRFNLCAQAGRVSVVQWYSSGEREKKKFIPWCVCMALDMVMFWVIRLTRDSHRYFHEKLRSVLTFSEDGFMMGIKLLPNSWDERDDTNFGRIG